MYWSNFCVHINKSQFFSVAIYSFSQIWFIIPLSRRPIDRYVRSYTFNREATWANRSLRRLVSMATKPTRPMRRRGGILRFLALKKRNRPTTTAKAYGSWSQWHSWPQVTFWMAFQALRLLYMHINDKQMAPMLFEEKKKKKQSLLSTKAFKKCFHIQ